jgi:hypothetical protein
VSGDRLDGVTMVDVHRHVMTPECEEHERRAVLGGNAAGLLRLCGVDGDRVHPPASVMVADGG